MQDKIPMQVNEQDEPMRDTGDSFSSDIPLKQAEMMNYFNVGINDYESIGKIEKIMDYFASLDDLHLMDLQLGQDPSMSRLNKIFLHVQLLKERQEVAEKKHIIEKRIMENYV